MAQQLLTAFGGGIAAPSANRYGRLSPTQAEHVRDELGDAVRVILDGGECPIGLESTIVSCLDERLRLLRPGHHPLAARAGGRRRSARRRCAARPEIAVCTMRRRRRWRSCRPTTWKRAAEIAAREKVAVLAMRPPLQAQRYMTWINAGKRPDTYAHNLYNHLRTLDRAGCVRILVQALPR